MILPDSCACSCFHENGTLHLRKTSSPRAGVIPPRPCQSRFPGPNERKCPALQFHRGARATGGATEVSHDAMAVEPSAASAATPSGRRAREHGLGPLVELRVRTGGRRVVHHWRRRAEPPHMAPKSARKSAGRLTYRTVAHCQFAADCVICFDVTSNGIPA